MADHEQRPLVLLEHLLQLLARLDVEVVRRLVEEEQVHLRVDQARELQPALLAARERPDRAVEILAGEEEPVEERRGLRAQEPRLPDRPLEERRPRVERVVQLAVLADLDGLAQAQDGVVPRAVRQQLPEEGRLPAAVGPHEADALAELDLELRVLEHGPVPVREREALDRQRDAPVAGAAREVRVEAPPSRLVPGALDLRHAFQAREHRLRALGLPRRVVGPRHVEEAAGLEADAALEPLLHLPLPLLQRERLRLLALEVAPVARPLDHLAAAHLPDRLRDRVEEVAVVAHHHDRRLRRPHELDEPLDAVHVEVVAGLVEQHHVGLGEQHPREPDHVPLAAGEGGHRLAPRLARQAEARQHRLDPALDVVPARGLVLVLQALVLREATQAALRAVLLGREARLEVPQPRVAREVRREGAAQLVEDRRPGLVDRFLCRGSDACAPRAHHAAGRRLERAAEDLEQRGLPHAVAPDDADPGPRLDVDGNVVEEDRAPEVHGGVGQGEERHERADATKPRAGA